MNATIWAAIIAAAASVVTAIISSITVRDRKKVQARAERRAEESKLSMELMSASCALSLVVAKKLTGQHTNGDVEAAMGKAETSQKAYDEFCRGVAASAVSKI